ncbi:cytochrome c biogenesis protein CcsA [Taibaiella soli]|uniref:ABC transporter permease n=1 Tax=Taibaiella soli TaxID=1649169 RepID=A0A2W2BJD9_9BACT|nr:cytochrome c biogenesis protein CcsA [Taibaiella soli]PZF73556.1 ABC transporter permease [Taibaiella soli]
MRQSWWKIVCVALLAYTLIGGMLLPVPRLFILNETIRNLYFHVPMWFAMVILFAVSFWYAIKYLRSGKMEDDIYSVQFANVGILFSVLGMLTGMEWATYTWDGGPWTGDPKQLCAALCMLIYFAYLVLRAGIKDEEKRANISAVMNIFAFALMIPLIFVIPRMVSSLHPGGSGNPAFSKYDLDSDMRMVFYPAIIAWILLSVWITSLCIRLNLIKYKKDNSFRFELEEKIAAKSKA